VTLTTDDDLAGPQPDAIIVPMREVLEPIHGPLHDLDVRGVAEDTYAWTALDEKGRRLSGTLAPQFAVGDEGKTIVLGWEVVLDGSTE
jgi:hypothetical protein